MWTIRHSRSLLGRVQPASLQITRNKWWKRIRHNIYPTLQERLEELDYERKDPELYAPVNIGLPEQRSLQEEVQNNRLDYIRKIKTNKNLEKEARKGKLEIDIDQVQDDWESGAGPQHLRMLAQHYGIFTHLFGNAYFVPQVVLNVSYEYDEETVSPVYRGNIIKPRESASIPAVQFSSHPDDLWTLILTNPDGNLLDNDLECLHWFIGNIEGGDVSSGQVMCDYLQPFPARGTGYQRMVFVLYKQHQHIDFSKYTRHQPCLSLKERNFSTLKMYRELQDVMTPAGLSWFQTDWDTSLTNFFHNNLKMREPVYEYDFPKPYLAPQKYFPHQRAFNKYLDLYKDPKQINKEVLLERLKKLHPFGPESPPLPFPNGDFLDRDLVSWLKKDLLIKQVGEGKYYDLFRGSNRPI